MTGALPHSLTTTDGRTVSVEFWDTPGQEDYDRLRPLCYPGTDLFLVAFSVGGNQVHHGHSFDNVKCSWLPEVRHHCKQAPIFVVGLKTDLRNSPDPRTQVAQDGSAVDMYDRSAAAFQRIGNPVSSQEGREMANAVGAIGYGECSAKDGVGIAELVQEAATLALALKPSKPGGFVRSGLSTVRNACVIC